MFDARYKGGGVENNFSLILFEWQTKMNERQSDRFL